MSFTPQLKRLVPALPPPRQVGGGTLGEVLERAFEGVPGLRGYVLDDHGELRQHVMVFVDGMVVRRLSHPVGEGADVQVLQALSGG